MKKILTLLMLIMLILAGCRQTTNQPEASLTIDLETAPDALQVGETTLEFRVTDDTGNPVSDATLNVRGDMTHAGMVPVIREDISADDDGLYTVPFEWSMGGDWLLDVTATLPDGSATTERFTFTVDSDGMNNMDDMPTPTAEN